MFELSDINGNGFKIIKSVKTVINGFDKSFLFIYLGFYVAFNTVQVISRRVVGRGRGNQYIQFLRVL